MTMQLSPLLVECNYDRNLGSALTMRSNYEKETLNTTRIYGRAARPAFFSIFFSYKRNTNIQNLDTLYPTHLSAQDRKSK